MLPTEERIRTWRSPRHWSLRVKLAVVLLVPGVLALVLGGLRIADETGEAAQLGQVTRLVAAEERFSTAVEAVAQERFDAAVYVAGDRRDDTDVRTSTAAVDAAVADVRTVLDEVEADDPTFGAPVAQAEQAFARLGDVRRLVTTSAAPPTAVVTRYTDLLTPLIELDRALLRGVDVDAVDGLAAALGGLAAARNELTLQYALVSVGDPSPADLQASEARLRTGLADFRSVLDPGQRVRYAGPIAGAGNTARAALLQSFLVGQDGGGDPAPVYGAVLAELNASQDGVRAELDAVSTRLRDAATMAAVVNALLLALALLLGGLVVGLVARAMIVALRRLRVGALDVAQRRLPEAVDRMQATNGEVAPLVVEPIGIDTREEIGEVARAFDAVHGEAVKLAAQQALLRNNINDIFVNLSQRSQGLVRRQLALIDGLERDEQDPDSLGNLFQLDHLATRLRRNNENLLVLAGAADLLTRRKKPVPARDVLRAAVSEVEQYQRVTVRRAPGVAVAGPVVNDLVHLVAELLDNATAFSPPDSRVELRATTGPGGTLVVEIADAGVGITPEDLARVNAQLASPPVVDVAVARRMGLFVVGRLAQRHNISVVLRPGPDGPGLHATVEVPAVYLQSGATPGAEPDLDVPTQALPVVVPRALSADPKPAPLPPAPRPSPEARPAASAGLPRREPRRDGPVPANDPLSGPWVPDPAAAEGPELPIYGEMRSAWFRQRRFASALGQDWTAQGPAGSGQHGSAGPERNGTQHRGTQHRGAERPGPDHAVADHTSAGPTGIGHNGADRPGHNGADRPGHNGAAGTGAEPDGHESWALSPPFPAPGAVPRPADAPLVERADPRPVEPVTEQAVTDQPVFLPPVPEQAVPDRVPDAPVADDRPAAAEADEWGAVDSGWAVARSAAVARPDTATTAAGLPKRSPRSQLVPGSMTPAGAGAGAQRSPTRSAEVVRGRLSGYQRGLREGREARAAENARRDPADGQGG